MQTDGATIDGHAMISVERAQEADAERLALLFDAYRQFYGQVSDVVAAKEFLTTRITRGDGIVLLAKAQETSETDARVLAGFAQLYRSLSSVALAPINVLNDLFVVPEWRGRGIARRLLRAAAIFAGRRGAVRLEIAARHTNHGALRLYEAEGFERDTEFTHLSLRVQSAPADPPDAPRSSTSVVHRERVADGESTAGLHFQRR